MCVAHSGSLHIAASGLRRQELTSSALKISIHDMRSFVEDIYGRSPYIHVMQYPCLCKSLVSLQWWII